MLSPGKSFSAKILLQKQNVSTSDHKTLLFIINKSPYGHQIIYFKTGKSGFSYFYHKTKPIKVIQN